MVCFLGPQCIAGSGALTLSGPADVRTRGGADSGTRSAGYDYSVTTFNAVAIEHTLARFFGKPIGDRFQFYDADVLRGGDPKELAEIVRQVAQTLESRVAFVRFRPQGVASPKVLLDNGISWLYGMAEQMETRRRREREDYHWEVFGAMVGVIIGLLETLESEIPVQ